MLSRFEVQHYKSLYDVKVDLEPLTVLIGPNGSGKSNICEALAVLSQFLKILTGMQHNNHYSTAINQAILEVNKNAVPASKFWHGVADYLSWSITSREFLISRDSGTKPELSLTLKDGQKNLLLSTNSESKESQTTAEARAFWEKSNYLNTSLASALNDVKIYDFVPTNLSNNAPPSSKMTKLGEGIVYSLVDILHSNRDRFDELEERFKRLVPNIRRIALPRQNNQVFTLELVDKFSDHRIPASDISDGTLRILAFLTAIYQDVTPSILCFEEIENGVHPWLLHKMMELLKIVSTEGVTGKPVQVIITTHSPVLLNYVEPHQVRAVELDAEGKTQIHALPTETTRFQKAMEAYDGALGELWFTGILGGNPVGGDPA
jgi:predicted ATPase